MKKDRIIRCQIQNTTRWLFMAAKGVMVKNINKAERLTTDQAEKRMKELQEAFPNVTLQTTAAPDAHDAEPDEPVALPPRSRSTTPAETKA